MDRIESIQLRKTPPLQIEIVKDGFVTHNQANNSDNGLYKYYKIDSLGLEKKRINWFVSILSFVVDLFSGGATGGIFRERNLLRLRYNKVEKRIILDNCDMHAVERIIQKIKLQIR